MKLVETKDTNYFETFMFSDNPDVPEAEMLLSESDSKFLEGWGYRKTFTIENSSENCSDNSSVTLSEDSSEQNCCFNCCNLQ